MKRMLAILMTLVLAVLCCVTAQAEEVMIRFLDITWGKDLETMCREMQDAGWINESGAACFASAEELAQRVRLGEEETESFVPLFAEQNGHYSVVFEDSSKNALLLQLSKDMLTKDWMGIGVEGIEMIFALNGQEEKLITAIVYLADHEVDLRPEFEKLYGEPADVDRNGAAWWEGFKNGEKKSILVYDGSTVLFSLFQAKERADEARPAP